MHLEQFPSRLQKLGFVYHLPGPASELEISSSEQRLNVSFPAQVRQFYQNYNGLRVENPPLEILPMETLNLTSGDRLHFATVDSQHRVFFDVSKINVAGQWDIRSEDDFQITMTMASLWSVKIWAWLRYRKRIWCEL
jgi:cell wall assembly regulator SMI1